MAALISRRTCCWHCRQSVGSLKVNVTPYPLLMQLFAHNILYAFWLKLANEPIHFRFADILLGIDTFQQLVVNLRDNMF